VSRTRFAPAPTGFLHLGHVVNAIHVWRLAREQGADVLLRIEDHDAQRCRPEYERALLDDLDWLGFVPDVYPTSVFRSGACDSRQSDRHHVDAEHATRLFRRGLVYGCRCARSDIAAAAPTTGEERCYAGTCRTLGLEPTDDVAWRVRLDRGLERFDDLLVGHQEQDPSTQCGDVAIRDRLGNWTYQFVVSVDDFLQDVDLVVRGRDLLASTGRQIRLASLLGRERPARFAHHPLVMKSPARKLSKADADTGIRELRSRGWTPERVIRHAQRGLEQTPS
jgi:glutamyl-tRNA synthetase/glutamyl-Q tRNA(Asp) synthetase